VFTEAALRAQALGDVFFHAPADHVARGQLLLLGLDVRHEAVALRVAQQAAVAAAAFGHQDAGREDAGGMELHRFHVAQGHRAGLQSDGVADAFADGGIGGHAVDAAGAAGGDGRGLGDVAAQLAGDEVAHHRAVAARTVVDERDGLGALVDGDAVADGVVAHGLQHGVAGAVGHVAGAPLLGAAEVALRHGAVGGGLLGDGDLLAVDDDRAVALAHAAPGHAPGGQLAHGLGRGVDEHAHHVLVGAPVAAAHGVLEVHVLVVALALDDVAQAGLHAALGGLGVAALGRHQRQHDGLVPAALGGDGQAQTGQAAADHQHIGVDHFHRGSLGCRWLTACARAVRGNRATRPVARPWLGWSARPACRSGPGCAAGPGRCAGRRPA
jgi:hypothetical protein